MRSECNSFGPLPPPSCQSTGRWLRRITERFARMAAVMLFLAVLVVPSAAWAISAAPFRKAAEQLSRSPTARNGIKRLARNPAGAVVVVVIAVGAWVGTLVAKKRKPDGSRSGPTGNAAAGAVLTEAVGAEPGTKRGSDVGVGVVAPGTANPGGTIMVQVAVDSAAGLAGAIERAKKLDSANRAVERGSLVIRNVADGDVLQFRLDMPKLALDESVQDHVWDGSPFSLQFFATVPDGAAIGASPARLLVSVGGRPVGRIGFVLNVVRDQSDGEHSAETVPHGYSQYFVSYSDKDFDQVLPRVQGMRLADRNVHFFFDKVSLAPGERYEPEIFDYIDNRADVFLLFWSAHSAASEWVEKEWRRALARQEEKDGLPDIIPVPLGRNVPPPPKELSHLHFGDGLLMLASDGR